MSRRRPLAQVLIDALADDEARPLPAQVRDLPIEEVLAAAALHRIRPALRRHLATTDDVPEHWRPPLESARHAQLFNHLRALSDLAAIDALFADAGVRWVVAKGPMLASLVWPHPDMREYTDLDVFVHPEDFASALSVLEANGFGFVDRNWPEIHRQNRAELALRGPSGFPLDLHWDFAVTPEARRQFPTDLPAMIERSRRVSLGSAVQVPVFDATDTVLHVAHHAALSGANRLVWIADAYFSARAPDLDAAALERRAAHARMLTPVAIVLARAERVFSSRLPLSPELRRRGERSPAARLAAWREGRHPFPGLPGDDVQSGTEVASGRDHAWATGTAAARRWWRMRRIEKKIAREGPLSNPLDDDVPDPRAREAYLAGLV